MSRNELCACGSGKRYKHCHGRVEYAGPSPLYREALAAQQSGALRRAEALYRRALESDPRDVDSLHMLGLVHFERRRYHEALELLADAAERTGWNDAVVRQNLGLVLAKLITPAANARQEALVAAYQARTRRIEEAPVVAGRVSVVLLAGDEARTARAIASVDAQTYRDLELVVVPGGGRDTGVSRERLARLTFAATFVASDARGPAQAANLGAAHATGRHLAFVEADDWFAPERIEAMVAAIARAEPLWGFSQVAYEGARGAAGSVVRPRHFLAHDLPSFTLLAHDAAERPSNLFIDRDLFLSLGGYRDGARDRGWDLCIRAARRVEPVVVARHLYVHEGPAPRRVPPGVTALADGAQPGARERFAEAVAGDPQAGNELGPHWPANRAVLLRAELRAGHGDRVAVQLMRALTAEWRARSEPTTRRVRASAPKSERVALVVLGMYRSGSSAIARALNLCGAFLPERVIAARLGINPKGFWETEAVTDLDARLLEHLGGEWNRVGFELPGTGPLVEEFLLNAREVLDTEYGDASTILIKDPRICVLAPLWHRALQAGGYRPAYVVLVRHPLEVAGSLETQGDMPLASGLALWLQYMRRAEDFASTTDARVVYVPYAELLEDWRRVVRRIGRRLDVALDLTTRAGEIDRFLEAGMRKHRADDAASDAAIAGEQADAIRALHRQMVERCDRDRAEE